MVIGVYKITNSVNNKVYVGKSVNVWKRWSTHKRKLLANIHFNTHLQAAVNKYGIEQFTCTVLESCSVNTLNEREIFWIMTLDSRNKNKGYNKVEGGEGGRLNDSSIAKMKASLTGRRLSKDTKQKISQALTGKSRPQEVKDKISASKKGEIKSESHKAKISTTLKGRPLTEETKLKMSIVRKGKPQKVVECPYCKQTGGTAMYRWHFENCKNK